eukprot:4004900-Lingulodinium_polyedra.AAC.1
MHLGRWASLSSCRLYLQHGEAELYKIVRNVPPAQWRSIETLAAIGPRVFEIVHWVRRAQAFNS